MTSARPVLHAREMAAGWETAHRPTDFKKKLRKFALSHVPSTCNQSCGFAYSVSCRPGRAFSWLSAPSKRDRPFPWASSPGQQEFPGACMSAGSHTWAVTCGPRATRGAASPVQEENKRSSPWVTPEVFLQLPGRVASLICCHSGRCRGEKPVCPHLLAAPSG